MSPFTSILFPTDFTEDSRQALECAAGFARSLHAKVRVIHALHVGQDAAEAARATEEMSRQVPAEFDDVVVERRLVRAPAPDIAILDTARDSDVDLIVLATHGHGGLRHALLGSVAERVVQLAPCAVLTVRRQSKPLDFERLRRIVCPVDFSEPSKQVLEIAVQLAKDHGAELVVLHVVEPVIYPVEYGMVPVTVAELERGAMIRAKAELEKLVATSIHGVVHARVCIETGAAFEVIAERARAEEADLIVLATHGLTGLKHLLIGSTAERVVRTADRPVLTVKPAAVKAAKAAKS